MKRILLILCLFSSVAYADSFSTTFDSQTGTIVVSTTPSSPTQVFSTGPYGFTRSYIYNASSYNLFYSTSNVGLSTVSISGVGSTSATPYVPSGATLSLDGVFSPYQGGVYCVLGSTTPQTIVRQRIR